MRSLRFARKFAPQQSAVAPQQPPATPSRFTVRVAAVSALTAVLVGSAAPPTAGGEWSPAGGEWSTGAGASLPPCPAGAPESTGAPAPPARVPSVDDPTACRAEPTRVEPVDTKQLPTPRPGYHHLGVTTVDEWSGVLGRLTVRDPVLRDDSLDFVATRFLAKRRTGNGKLTWLEVGWAETGWSGGDAQRIYTFDSEGRAWTFFDEYRLGDGDQVWIHLHKDAGSWRAWLWWGERWHLLAAPELPMPDRAQLEQYVEVHRDPQASRGSVSVPPIRVDNVQVQAKPDGPLQSWHAATVPTVTPLTSTDYCVEWEIQYHNWSAGDCTVQE